MPQRHAQLASQLAGHTCGSVGSPPPPPQPVHWHGHDSRNFPGPDDRPLSDKQQGKQFGQILTRRMLGLENRLA